MAYVLHVCHILCHMAISFIRNITSRRGGKDHGTWKVKKRSNVWKSGNLEDSRRPFLSFIEEAAGWGVFDYSSCREEIFQNVKLSTNCTESYKFAPLASHDLGWGKPFAMQRVFWIIFALLRNPSPMVLLVTPIKTHWFTKVNFGSILLPFWDK